MITVIEHPMLLEYAHFKGKVLYPELVSKLWQNLLLAWLWTREPTKLSSPHNRPCPGSASHPCRRNQSSTSWRTRSEACQPSCPACSSSRSVAHPPAQDCRMTRRPSPSHLPSSASSDWSHSTSRSARSIG